MQYSWEYPYTSRAPTNVPGSTANLASLHFTLQILQHWIPFPGIVAAESSLSSDLSTSSSLFPTFSHCAIITISPSNFRAFALPKMRYPTAFVALLVAMCCASPSTCDSADSLELHPPYSYGDDVRTNQVQRQRSVPRHKASAAARSMALIIRGAIMAGIVFLLVRCVAYISALSRVPEGLKRRLAEESSCGEEVSNAFCFLLPERFLPRKECAE